jgi:hypothetical protein
MYCKTWHKKSSLYIWWNWLFPCLKANTLKANQWDPFDFIEKAIIKWVELWFKENPSRSEINENTNYVESNCARTRYDISVVNRWKISNNKFNGIQDFVLGLSLVKVLGHV